MKKLSILFTLILTIGFLSCENENDIHNALHTEQLKTVEKGHAVFAQILAKAVENSNELRVFLKNEALKKFDGDYDILYQMVKDKKVKKQMSFADLLEKYNDTNEELEILTNNFPLLTIFIPDLESFSVKTWNTNETPLVAIANHKDSQLSEKTLFFNSSGFAFEQQNQIIPDFPVVVIKTNESLVVKGTHEDLLNTKMKSVSVNAGNFSYDFLFQPESISNENEELNSKRAGFILNPNSNTSNPNFAKRPIDKKLLDAALKAKSSNCNSCYHRDYIYYDIFPPEGRNEGPIDTRYSEAITSIRLSSFSVFRTITEDWKEGNLEFRFKILFIGGDDSLSELSLVTSVQRNDLIEVKDGNTIETVQVTFRKPITIAPWEMDRYGDRWKIITFEYDPSEEIERTVTHQTTKGSNFKLDLEIDKLVKIGTGFSSEKKRTVTNSTKIKYTKESNPLGETIWNWFAPVVTKYASNPSGYWEYFETHEQSTGSIILTLEPVKTY